MNLRKILTNRKGFTLMEIIVVLIIIAVLAAALIPSFVGFIRDSRSATAINQARMGMNAAQVLVTEAQGQTPPQAPSTVAGTYSAAEAGAVTATMNQARFWQLVRDDVDPAGVFVIGTGDFEGTRITGLQYTGAGFVVTITGGRANAVPVSP